MKPAIWRELPPEPRPVYRVRYPEDWDRQKAENQLRSDAYWCTGLLADRIVAWMRAHP